MPTQTARPYHLAAGEGEPMSWFTAHVGSETYRGRPGSFVFFPRGVPHTFTIEGPVARMLL
jgi:uncharacterized RmlC-like cupin family protein